MPDKIDELRAKWLANGCGAAAEFDAIVEIVRAVTVPEAPAKPSPADTHHPVKAKAAKHK